MKSLKSLIPMILLLALSLSHSQTADTSVVTSISGDSTVAPETPIKILTPTAPSFSAVHIVLEETVDPGMAAYTKRAIEQAVQQGPDYILLEVNTFGGELMAAFDIVDAITAVPDSIKTVALVNKKAISAGALISLAANELYMKPSTTIGDCAPIIQGKEGPTMLGEKIQSPLRAKFRNLAQKNGYPVLLSEAMVSEKFDIISISKGDSVQFFQRIHYNELGEAEKSAWTKDGWSTPRTIVQEGELLTLTNLEAQQWGFSKGTVESLDELKNKLSITTAPQVHISWAENLARILRTISPILMLIGFGALYMELQSPGFGVFGVIGIVMLGTVYGGQNVAHLTGQLPTVLLIVGIILILLEMFAFPGTLIAGLTGAGFMAAALIMSLQHVPLPFQSDESSLSGALILVLTAALTAMLFPILSTRFLMPLLPKRFRVIQEETLEHFQSPKIDLAGNFTVGTLGKSLSLLRPSGRAVINGKRIEVFARDGFIESERSIRVVSVANNRITVVEAQQEGIS